MNRRKLKYSVFMVILGLLGCASGQPERVVVPKAEIKVYYYVGAVDANLKASPDYNGADVGPLTLNERVEKLTLGPAGWFQVRTEDGRKGWVNEKFLKVAPLAQFFVRRWGVNLRTEPQEPSKLVTRLKTNDQVKLVEQTPQGWAKITVANTQQTGWLKIGDLSVEPVVVRPVRRRPAQPPKEPAGKTTETKAGEEPASNLLTPTPAEAAPPPAKQPSRAPKANPEMFEPF